MAAAEAEREAFIRRWNGQCRMLADTRRKPGPGPARLYQGQSFHNQLVVLTAPRDAVVLSVAKISVGSVVTSAEPLIQLVPLDAPLSVEADILAIDSGYVRAGTR